MSEISKAPPSVKAAITQKVNQNQKRNADESSIEMQSIKIARESSGDNHTTTSARTNISTEVSTEANQDIERAEKVLDANRPAQVVENNEKEKVKEKENEESAKALNEALDQSIIQSWGDVGGAKD